MHSAATTNRRRRGRHSSRGYRVNYCHHVTHSGHHCQHDQRYDHFLNGR
jgi:hypothetical protein